jgi:hypothetical protein
MKATFPYNKIQATKICGLVIRRPLYIEDGCLLGCCNVLSGKY